MPDPGSYELTSLIKRLYVLQAQNIDAALKPYGLARTQYLVMHYLQADGGVPTGWLQERLQVEGATLTGIIDTLVAKGLAERVEQPEDKRRKNIVLTAAGRRLMHKITPPGPLVQQVLMRDVSPHAVKQFRETMERMILNLEENLYAMTIEQEAEGEPN